MFLINARSPLNECCIDFSPVIAASSRINLPSSVDWGDFWVVLSVACLWEKLFMYQQLFSLIFACIASAAVSAGCGRHVYYLGL